MKIGINLLLWTGHVTPQAHRHIVEAIAATGYDGVEIPVFDTSNPGHYRTLGFLLDELGLRRTVSTTIPDVRRNPLSADPSVRAAALEHVQRVTDCASALGAELVVGPLFQPLGTFTGSGPTEVELERCAAFFKAIGPVMRNAGITCAIEPLNRFEAYLLNTSAQAVAMMERVGDPAIGILYDTFHAHIEEKDPVKALDVLCDAGVLAHVHISENDRGTPGTGHARIRESIALLQERSYDGWLTIEAFGKEVPELAAATRVWRDFFSSPSAVVCDGYRYIHDCIRAGQL